MKLRLKRLLCISGDGEDDTPIADLLSDLPLELSLHILRMLDAPTLFYVSLVSKRWLNLVRSDSVLMKRMKEENKRQKKEKVRDYLNSTLHLPFSTRDRLHRFTSIRCGDADTDFPSSFRKLDELCDSPSRSTLISSKQKKRFKTREVLRYLGGFPADSSVNLFDGGIGSFYPNPMICSP